MRMGDHKRQNHRHSPWPADVAAGKHPASPHNGRHQSVSAVPPAADALQSLLMETTQKLTPFNITSFAQRHCLICGKAGHPYATCALFAGELCLFNEHDASVYLMPHADWVMTATLGDVVAYVESTTHIPRDCFGLWVHGEPLAQLLWQAPSHGKQPPLSADGRHMNLAPGALRTRCCAVGVLPGTVVYVGVGGRWGEPQRWRSGRQSSSGQADPVVTEVGGGGRVPGAATCQGSLPPSVAVSAILPCASHATSLLSDHEAI